jgi:hypothetical protein
MLSAIIEQMHSGTPRFRFFDVIYVVRYRIFAKVVRSSVFEWALGPEAIYGHANVNPITSPSDVSMLVE